MTTNTVEEGPMFWTRDLDRHYLGSFSAAVMQANRNLEDYSQVEVGSSSTFVGVYDGHNGYHAAAHARRNFTRHLTEYVTCTPIMSGNVLKHSFERTEQSWLQHVDAQFGPHPYIAACGTCCLVGVIWRGNLYVANVGDSRAILGREEEGSDKIVVQQLTRDDNVRDPRVRAEVMSEHGDEPDFIVEDKKSKGVFRIKGRSQISKSIGDAYLKIPKFNLDRYEGYQLSTPIRKDRPALSAEPIASKILIEPQDRFVIFASDGLWDLMSNQEVADFVHENPNEGIAERLVMHALTELAVQLGGSSYEDLKQYTRESGQRRKIHDDISVVVIFFDHTLQLDADIQEEFPKYSISEGSVSTKGESNFTAVLDAISLSPPDKRTILIQNLQYQTRSSILYAKFKECGATQHLTLDQHGFSGQVRFYEELAASTCIKRYRNRLILRGKLVCLSYNWEYMYRNDFKLVDYICSVEEQATTVCFRNLASNMTIESIRGFLLDRNLALNNEPIIYLLQKKKIVTQNEEELCALVNFKSTEMTRQALNLTGTEYLGKRVIIYQESVLSILQGTMKERFQIISARLREAFRY